MFGEFFETLRQVGVPVTLREYLTLLEAVEKEAAEYRVDSFYHLARATLVKDERWFDRFDLVFAHVFADALESGDFLEQLPAEWLQRLAERVLSPEEMAKIEGVGDWQQLMDLLKKRLEEQKERHQGGSKWIGTAGTSPFGAYGYNPEGIRIGQDGSRHRRAVKVWDRREFRDFDDSVELGTRNIRVALRRLRRFVREGAKDILNLPATIRKTANNGGYLDIEMEAERHNAIKVLLLLDVGGSMDDHIHDVERLFSACRSEFKHLEHYYFHNCLYERVWKDSRRRHAETVRTEDVLRTYPRDYKLVFVGDASMSPYEIVTPGGAVEHQNEEPGRVWLERATAKFQNFVWINPTPRDHWEWTHSIGMIQDIVEDRMVPLTLAGIERAVDLLQ